MPELPPGIRVVRCDVDYGPATKILPTCMDLRGVDAQILFCDDDGVFAPHWASTLFDLQRDRPDEAVAGYVRPVHGYVPNEVTPLREPRAREIPIRRDWSYRFGRLVHKTLGAPPPWRRPIVQAGYGEIFFGFAGVVVRPEFFDDEARNIPAEAWLVDDIWLSAQLALKGIPVYCPRRLPSPRAFAHSEIDALLELEVNGSNRFDLNRMASIYCRDNLDIWNG